MCCNFNGVDLFYIQGINQGLNSLIPRNVNAKDSLFISNIQNLTESEKQAELNELNKEAVEVEVRTLDHVDQEANFPNIDLLKIDVQGADIQVLEGAGDYLGSIMAITVEVDTNEYQNTRNSFSAIKNLLAPFGFRLVKRSLTGRIVRRLKGIKINVESDDPTFINISLYKNQKPRGFWAYQRG